MDELNFSVGVNNAQRTVLMIHGGGMSSSLEMGENTTVQLIRMLAATIPNYTININDNTENSNA